MIYSGEAIGHAGSALGRGDEHHEALVVALQEVLHGGAALAIVLEAHAE